jgi:flagellar protein FliO/FliZ
VPRVRPYARARRSILPAATALALVLAGPAAAGGGYKDKTPLPASLSHPAPTGTAHAGVSGGAVFRTLLGLLVVLGVIYGLYWVLKRYAATKGARSDGQMDIVATTALGPAQALHLVRVGDELVLVGRAEQSVTGIRVYPPEEAGPLLEALRGRDDGQLHEPGRSGGVWSVALDELRRRTART